MAGASPNFFLQFTFSFNSLVHDPAPRLSKPITKCCPIGEAYKYFENAGSGECTKVNESASNNVWISINGHLFDENVLSDQGVLIHTNDTVRNIIISAT